MGIFFSALMILLGVLGAQALIDEKIPAGKAVTAKISQYQDVIGFIGLVVGLMSVLEWILVFHYFSISPVRILVSVVDTLLLLGLGLIFGLGFIRKNLKDPGTSFLAQLEMLRAEFLPYRQILGLGSIGFGIIYFAL